MVTPRRQFAQLGKPLDDYERERIAMCRNPQNAKLIELTVKHLLARRQTLQH